MRDKSTKLLHDNFETLKCHFLLGPRCESDFHFPYKVITYRKYMQLLILESMGAPYRKYMQLLILESMRCPLHVE